MESSQLLVVAACAPLSFFNNGELRLRMRSPHKWVPKMHTKTRRPQQYQQQTTELYIFCIENIIIFLVDGLAPRVCTIPCHYRSQKTPPPTKIAHITQASNKYNHQTHNYYLPIKSNHGSYKAIFRMQSSTQQQE